MSRVLPLHLTDADRLRGILRAFTEAQKDPQARIPARLAILLEGARVAEEDRINRYADAKIGADKLNPPHDERADLMATGTPYRPGR